jgi:hypothetical protein
MLIMRYALGDGTESWVATFGGDGQDDNTRGFDITSDGDVVVGIAANSDANGNIMKVNKVGDIQWQSTFTETTTSPRDVFIDPRNGNIIVQGYTNLGSPSLDRGLTLKYNSAGSLQWQRMLSHSTSALLGRASIVNSDGDIFSVSRMYPSPTNGAGDPNDILLAKYNSAGTLLWTKTYLGSGGDWAFQMVPAPNGGAYLSGFSNAGSPANQFILLMHVDSDGDIVWQKSVDSASTETGREIASDNAGNVIIACGTTPGLGIMKFNSSGTVQWQRQLGVGTGVMIGCCVDGDDNIYVTGRHNNIAVVAKYNSSGVIQWQRELDGTTGTDEGWKIGHYNGWLFIAGSTNTPTGDAVLLAKLKDDGSDTGTFGNSEFTYSASSLPESASSLTVSVSSVSTTTDSITDAAGTTTSGTGSLTKTVYSQD